MSEAMEQQGAVSRRRFKPYPAYKDSGVEWLGEIPAGWEVKPFKALLTRNDSGVWGEDFADDGVVVLRSTEQTVDGRWRIEDPARRRLTAREASESRLEVGDLVTTKSSGSDLHIGKTSIVDESVAALKCSFSNFMQRLRVATPQEPRHYWYLLNCPVAREQLVFLSSTTTGLGNLNGSILGAIRIPVAADDEQRDIAAFLDRETARIDALVAKNERLIELLQEKRTALITHAVTKGLDPTAPMKDSGVEWLGEIPAHWSAFRFKLLFRNIYRYPTYYDIEYVPDGVPEVRGEALLDGRIIALPDQRYISAETSKQFARTILQEGDLVISVRGTMGKVGLVLREFAGANITANLLKLSPREDLASGSYLSWLMRSEFFLKSLDRQSPQTTIQTITMPQLASIVLPIPGLADQRAIAAFLDRETARIDALVAKVREASDRLKELRTALISAAVTGKIDVREEVA